MTLKDPRDRKELTERQKVESIVAAILMAGERISAELSIIETERRKGGPLDTYHYPDADDMAVEAMLLVDKCCED